MMHGTRELIIFALWWGLVVPLYLLVIALFFRRRGTQVIKTRSPLLLLCSAISGFFLLSYMASRSLFDKQIPCPTTYYLGVVFFLLIILPYLLRCYRLIGIFDLTMAKASMLPEISSSNSLKLTTINVSPLPHHNSNINFQDIIKKRAAYTEPRMLKILAASVGILVVVLVVVHGALSSTALKSGTPTCDVTEGQVILAIIALMMLLALVFVFLIYKMKHVTDAFSINNELKVVCGLSFVHIGVALWLQSSQYSWPSSPYVGYVTASLVIFSIAVSVFWPLLASYSRTITLPTNVSTKLPERTATGSVVEPQFLDFLKDPISHKWFQEFLINEFSVENILFWTEVQDFKETTNQEDMNNTAARIYEKYIVDGSPFQVNLNPENVAATRELMSGTIGLNVFDAPEDEIFQVMKGDAYPRFRHSIFCKRMLHEMREKNLDVQVATAAQLI